MPVKPIPKEAVRELKDIGWALWHRLNRKTVLTDTEFFRQIKTPAVRVERVAETTTAKEVLKKTIQRIRKHNNDKSLGKKKYILEEPNAHVIHEKLIAMVLPDVPTVSQMLKKGGDKRKEFFRELRERGMHKVNENLLNRAMLERTYKTVLKNTEIPNHKMFLLGVERGKYVFMPNPNQRIIKNQEEKPVSRK